jgi:hypothetical protein
VILASIFSMSHRIIRGTGGSATKRQSCVGMTGVRIAGVLLT